MYSAPVPKLVANTPVSDLLNTMATNLGARAEMILVRLMDGLRVIRRFLYPAVKAITLREWPIDTAGYMSETVDGIEIVGTDKFISRTKQALALLKGTSFFSEITRYIGVIKEERRSGVCIFSVKPTFEVGAKTWQSPLVWYAGAIAHDACHSKLYFEEKAKRWLSVPLKAWMGAEAEKKCFLYQIAVLEELKRVACEKVPLMSARIDESMSALIDYLKKEAENPTHQGNNTWADYKKRNW